VLLPAAPAASVPAAAARSVCLLGV
jgi:hypothetical protein